MKVVILCGGYGTRIRDVTESLPKPMINIGPYPILFHIMKYYASFGHKEFILCLGYKSDVIKDYFLNLKAHTSDLSIDLATGNHTYHSEQGRLDWNVTLAETGLSTMTGGRVKKIQKYLGRDESFMLTYGDGVGDVDLDSLVKFHASHNKILTVTGVRPPGRFGELNADRDGVVREFNEKPQASGGRISGGFFVARRELFDVIPDDETCVFEQEPIRSLVRRQQMTVYEHNGFWQPMDTYREYTLLNELFASGRAPWLR
jgi:glucose-1-phosphate cytidylyltransferase